MTPKLVTCCTVAAFVGTYLAFSFILWDVNAIHWGDAGRTFYLILSIFLSAWLSFFPGWED